MEISAETLVILLVLIPGFVSSAILDMVLVRLSRESWAKLIEALMLSFLIYAVVGGMLRLSPFVISDPKLSADVEKLRGLINPTFVLATLACSVALPLAMGFIARRNWHMRLLHKLGITERTGRTTIWLDVFAEQKSYVTCNLTGERRIFGWPLYYSEDAGGSGPSLYLHDPAWIVDGVHVPLGIAGILLVEKDGIESIEFTGFPGKESPAKEDAAYEQDGTVETGGHQRLQPTPSPASKKSPQAQSGTASEEIAETCD